jgi:DNA-binding NarL/FixJ family response regulator
MLGMVLHRAVADADPKDTADAPALTRREQDVLHLLADGVSVKAAARELGISINTCRGYVHGVLAKLEAPSQLAAVVKATKLGILRSVRA